MGCDLFYFDCYFDLSDCCYFFMLGPFFFFFLLFLHV